MSASDALTDLRRARLRTEEAIQLAMAQRRSPACHYAFRRARTHIEQAISALDSGLAAWTGPPEPPEPSGTDLLPLQDDGYPDALHG